ncbi:MAG: shikimate kinase [Clostridia bacterium]|nr:shikimate kinase [Clostridia bacterium]
MKYGCIGERLKHSFSKEIHNALADYEYDIREIPRDELRAFLETRDFLAVNVTIPYKQLVIPYLYYIDEHAKAIGAVNTIVNKGGKLYGYNTDFYGMSMLLSHADIDLKGKKVAILGTGGTSKTAFAVASALSAREIVTVSRSEQRGSVTYDELYELHGDTEVIINTTPVGMYPNIFGKPVELSKCPILTGVIDAVYNPLRTPLISQAKERGISAQGGLYMLVAQGVRASEIFMDTTYERQALDLVYQKMMKEKENIVLTGMPSSGKSTVGKLLAEYLNREFIDTDSLIEEKTDMSIPDIFKTFGEERFREIECEVVRDIAAKTGVVIATGGGVPLRHENVSALKQNGRVYFIDRPVEELIATGDRPLSSTKEAVYKRYNERYEVYKASADVLIDADCPADMVAEKITGEIGV